MPWTSPDLTELQVKLRRDLRDPDGKVFSPEMLMDYANEGTVELSRVKPIEVWGDIAGLPVDLDPQPVDIWALALVFSNTEVRYLPPMDENVASEGWLFYGGSLVFSPRLSIQLIDWLEPASGAQPATLRWYGYRSREVFDGTPDEVADFKTPEDEMCVRRYARWAGFRALDSDRSLYQQWQTQANNTDVSATQLTQMVSVAESEWDQLRRKVMLFRHPPLGTR